MRKLVLNIALALVALLVGGTATAQYNKSYFYHVGRNFLIDNRFEDAIETLNILIKVDADVYEGYFLRGVAKYNLDDLLGAEQDFSTAIEKNPVYTIAYKYRAITRSRLGNYDDALHDFQEAIDLRPDLADPYYSRGVTYLLSQQFEKAVSDFDQFIRQQSKVSDAYINRGTAYLFLKDTLRANEDYNTAVRTNRENPNAYARRGALYLTQNRYDEALADFDMAIACDTAYVIAYFNRAIVYSKSVKPMLALADFDRVIDLDSTNSLAYFNRALVRSQIGDYNRALQDYNKVATYSPGNVLVYYNRAMLQTQLGELEPAVKDYDKAIELYPDFANAYLGRSELRYLLRDEKGSKKDREIAQRKIAEYRSKLTDSTFSIYADTSRQFNQLLSFDSKFAGKDFQKTSMSNNTNVTLRPLFKFILTYPDSVTTIDPQRYYLVRVEEFKKYLGTPNLELSNRETTIPADSLFAIDKRISESMLGYDDDWRKLFERGVSQGLIRQYTSSVNSYTAAIERNPTNPFLYLNRSTTRSEMIDFISSIDNGYQRISIESDPVSRLKNSSNRVYSYDDAIEDLNKVAKLFPEFAHVYYNRANLQALSGNLPAAFDDYTLAIKLNPNFAEAYYNRGLVQIYLKDTRKGCLDISKAGELGIKEAYQVLKRYSQAE